MIVCGAATILNENHSCLQFLRRGTGTTQSNSNGRQASGANKRFSLHSGHESVFRRYVEGAEWSGKSPSFS